MYTCKLVRDKYDVTTRPTCKDLLDAVGGSGASCKSTRKRFKWRGGLGPIAIVKGCARWSPTARIPEDGMPGTYPLEMRLRLVRFVI